MGDKCVLFSIWDSNMAGYEWEWTFVLNSTADNRYTLSCTQTVLKGSPTRIPAKRGLENAVEIYDALDGLIEAAGHSLTEARLEEAAKSIEEFDDKLAAAIRRAPEDSEARADEKSAAAHKARLEALLPVREKIDQYVMTFDDGLLRYCGGSHRSWTRRFMENDFLENGTLPSGRHRIVVEGPPKGYTGGEHDFDDLK